MAIIHLVTKIAAPANICFDLSRDIDLHKQSMAHTKEVAIEGITSGLIGLDETVTWQAKHLGFNFKMTVKITAFEHPVYFVDEMIKGPFKRLRHTHEFEQHDGYTIMKDTFDFASPVGLIGKIVDALLLKSYMTQLLKVRNQLIKDMAETNIR
jgi:ligand-binding SRPBCC domain-containing protein